MTIPLHQLSWFAERSLVAPGGTPVADALAPGPTQLMVHDWETSVLTR